MGKRELIALLNLSSWCLVMVERLFLTVPRGCLQFVIVVFPDHTHLLFFSRCSMGTTKVQISLCNSSIRAALSCSTDYTLTINHATSTKCKCTYDCKVQMFKITVVLISFLSANLACFLVVCCFFSKSTFSKNDFRKTFRVTNSLTPDQIRLVALASTCSLPTRLWDVLMICSRATPFVKTRMFPSRP